MSTNVVNLDALIPREDMSEPSDQGGEPIDKIDIHHLDAHFFVRALRKPDFQRETVRWPPEKVADLIRAFLDRDLIPAVILWLRGKYVFVIDGAHRLGALIAWVKDDYGDGRQSRQFFGEIPEEQRKVAERTRKLVNADIGPYGEYLAGLRDPSNARAAIRSRLTNLAVHNLVAQWVPSVEQQAAEDSFFKINQAATSIDPTEQRILKSRRSPNSVAARAIVRGGAGHKYWANYGDAVRKQIESLAQEIHKALYEPPIGDLPVKTMDLPVAGRGYSALPFVFGLVNWANGIPDPRRKADLDKALPEDADGMKTIEFLKAVKDVVQLLTTNMPGALGVHPVVYFYTRGGEFQPNAFLATAELLTKLAKDGRLRQFTKARRAFEDFLLAHKEFITLTIKRQGSGHRSLNRIVGYLDLVFTQIAAGKSDEETLEALRADANYAYLIAMHGPSAKYGGNPSRRFSRSTKSAAFLAAAIQSSVRCAICGAMVHKNSLHIDHIERAADGGGTDMRNAQVTHPYCNSSKKSPAA